MDKATWRNRMAVTITGPNTNRLFPVGNRVRGGVRAAAAKFGSFTAVYLVVITALDHFNDAF
jgi:hypothetical protein